MVLAPVFWILTRSLRSGPPVGVAFGPRFAGTIKLKKQAGMNKACGKIIDGP